LTSLKLKKILFFQDFFSHEFFSPFHFFNDLSPDVFNEGEEEFTQTLFCHLVFDAINTFYLWNLKVKLYLHWQSFLTKTSVILWCNFATLLSFTIFGEVTQIEMILTVPSHPRWPRQVRVA